MAEGKPPRRTGVYRKYSSRTGQQTGSWYSTVFISKSGRNITVGTFPTEQQAIDAREEYIAGMARHGIVAV